MNYIWNWYASALVIWWFGVLVIWFVGALVVWWGLLFSIAVVNQFSFKLKICSIKVGFG